MDSQLKKGSLEICVLASLLNGDSYGYKIIKDLEDVIEVKESTLYPILKRLEKNGLVKAYSVESNGRLRKFYSITNEGYLKIQAYLIDFKELLNIYKYIERGVKDETRILK